jgi:ATP-dependent helicase HrpB
MLIPLPIDSSLERIAAIVRDNLLTIVHAPPGSGKTTRVGPALLRQLADVAKHRIYLLQPRRLAARSVAMRIADENAWE